MRTFVLSILVMVIQAQALFGQQPTAADGDVIKDLWFFGRRNYEAALVEEKAMNLREAYVKYAKALEYFRHLHAKYPKWNVAKVKARINLCHKKIIGVGERLGLDNKVVSAEQLLSENKRLKKYALSVRKQIKGLTDVAARERTKYDSWLKDNQATLERLRREKAELSERCARVEERAERLRSLEGMDEKLAKVKGQLQDALTKVDAVKENNQLLKTKVSDLESRSADSTTVSTEVDRLEKENERLRTQLAAVAETVDDKDAAPAEANAKLVEEKAGLEEEVKRLQSLLEDKVARMEADAEGSDDLGERNRALTERLKLESEKRSGLEAVVADLKESLAAKSSEAAKTAANATARNDELTRLRADMEELKGQLAAANGESVELNKELGGSKADCAGLGEDLRVKKAELERLEKLHEATLAENRKFHEKMGEVVQFMHDARSDQRKKARELEVALDNLEATRKELDESRVALTENERKIGKLNERLESFKVSFGDAETKLRRELESMAKEKLELSEENKALERRLAEALGEIEKKNASLRERVAAVETLRNNADKGGEALKKEKNRVERLTKEKERLNGLIKNLNIKYEKVAYLFSAMKKDHDRSQREIADLKRRSRNAISNGNDAASEMAVKVEKLRNDAEAAVTAKNLLQEELRVLKKSFAKLAENYDNLRKRYDGAKSAVKKSRRDLANSRKENNTPDVTDLIDREKVIADLSMKNSALFKKYELAQKKLALLESKIRALKRQLDNDKELSEDIQELKLKLAHEKADKLNLEKKLSESD